MNCKDARAGRMQDLMKKTFIFFLCCSTLLYGCFPLSPLTQEDWLAQSSLPEREILVTLVDGSVIKSQPHHYIYTTEPSNFIYGSGRQRHRFIRGEHKEFIGKVYRSSIDSLGFIGRYFVCYLPDSTDIYFEGGNYIVITPDRSHGLWCAGILTFDGKDTIFSGYVPGDRIKQIEMRKFSEWQTYFLVAGVTVIIVIIIFLSSLSKIGKMENLHLKF
jgi:hypothetical protein